MSLRDSKSRALLTLPAFALMILLSVLLIQTGKSSFAVGFGWVTIALSILLLFRLLKRRSR